jgi:cyanophycinase
MLYLYSGFSPDFEENIKHFLFSNNTLVDSVTLLLQGGPGYENYLDSYIEPIKYYGVKNINIIVPMNNRNEIEKNDIEIIRQSDSVFIGGGYTPRYAELYGTEEITKIIKEKFMKGINIAGLSAGSLIMNDIVKSDNKTFNGLGLVRNMNIYPHFEDEKYGYNMIKDAIENLGMCCYGIETNAYLEINNKGNINKKGNGKVYKATNKSKGEVELIELLP